MGRRSTISALFSGFLELAQRGQRVQVAQREELEELAGGAVQNRPADLFLLPDDSDQPAIEQGLEYRARIDAANVLELLWAGDRLPVGDDRQRLDGGAGEPLRLDFQKPAYELGRLAARYCQPPATSCNTMPAKPSRRSPC